MSLVFLNKEDVQLARNSSGREVLRHNIKGYSLILFYSPRAETCVEYFQVFKQIPKIFSGCQIGLFNVEKDRQTMEMYKRMFEYVPFIVLYYDGIPFQQYDGPADDKTICDFIIEIANSNRQKQRAQPQERNVLDNGRHPQNQQHQQGGYQHSAERSQQEAPPKNKHFGIPLYGKDDIKYLKFDTAYVGRIAGR